MRQALKDEMVRRGVPEAKITVVPNGVDVERFTPRPRHRALADELGIGERRVIGYVGSLLDYEGLDLLLHAVAQVHAGGIAEVVVLLVGDGDQLDSLQQLAVELGIADQVVFAGRVPHHRVQDYYSLIDIAPFPRKSSPVTEMVSPLKPFEAMAMDKVVIAADVAALAEVIEEGVNGFLFAKEDVAALADTLERALEAEAAQPLRPRQWVAENRNWKRLSGIVEDVYKRLGAG